MEFEEKVQKINAKLNRSLCDKQNIVIRGGGIHTEKLLGKTCILEFWEKISIVDRNPGGVIGNKIIKGMEEVQWNLVDAVIISSLIYQKEMKEELLSNKDFKGEIICFYEEHDVAQFFELQNDFDFLTLEKVQSWEVAAKESKQGYTNEGIHQFNYEKLMECRKRNEKDKTRHYYDVLFYLLKTVLQLQKKEISVLDFGGGNGMFFLNLKYYLKNLDIECKWTIIEQEQIVNQMKEYNDIGVIFKKSMKDVDEREKIDIALFGGSLQYLEDYGNVIDGIKRFTPHRIVLLKTPVSHETFVTVQHVNRMGNHKYYTAKFPCRVMKEEELISLFSEQYQLEDAGEDVDSPANFLDDHIVRWKIFAFEIGT